MTVCTGPGCDRPVLARGLCSGHYRQAKRGGPLKPLRPRGPDRDGCSVPDCDRPHHAHGYCRMHGLRWERTGTPAPAPPRPTHCWDCGRDLAELPVRKGRCPKCYSRRRRKEAQAKEAAGA